MHKAADTAAIIVFWGPPVVMVAAGVAIDVLTVGIAANFGGAFIGAGISGAVVGVTGIVDVAKGQHFDIGKSWEEWGISTAVGFAAGLISGGE